MRPHRYSVYLSDAEKQLLCQLKRAGKTERRLADRARIILWTAEWVSVEEIARRLGIHRATVINCRRWFMERREQGMPMVESLRDRPRSGRPPTFKPPEIAQIKAVACERPAKLNLPLSRFSLGEIVLWIRQSGIVPAISASTIWRLLHHDAIRPWYYRAWLFPRVSDFVAKATPVLDLYQHMWRGKPLGARDYVLSTDEKTAIQALARLHSTLAPASGQPGRSEFEYRRHGTVAYLAALDVFTGRVFGRVDKTTGIVPFSQLVDLVMKQEPYASGECVFWILDGGPSHHPHTSPSRLKKAYPILAAIGNSER